MRGGNEKIGLLFLKYDFFFAFSSRGRKLSLSIMENEKSRDFSFPLMERNNFSIRHSVITFVL